MTDKEPTPWLQADPALLPRTLRGRSLPLGWWYLPLYRHTVRERVALVEPGGARVAVVWRNQWRQALRHILRTGKVHHFHRAPTYRWADDDG